MLEGHIKYSPEEVKDMYYTLLSPGNKYELKMPVYREYFKKLNQQGV